jgi:hypothetical protein
MRKLQKEKREPARVPVFFISTQYKHLPEIRLHKHKKMQKLRSTFIENFCKDTKNVPNDKKIFYGSSELWSFSPHGLPEKRRGIRGKDRGKKMGRRW